jgi:hypothetical protein
MPNHFRRLRVALGLPLRQQARVFQTIAFLEFPVNKDKAIPAHR